MIYSMTGFARTERQGEWGVLVCEMRSINHRYLELSLYLPESLRYLEKMLREDIRKLVKRGKVECYLRYQMPTEAKAEIAINSALAESLCQATQKIATMLTHVAPINPMDILNFSGVLVPQESHHTELENEIVQTIQDASTALTEARQREGEALQQFLLQRLDSIKEALALVQGRAPILIREQEERLRHRFAELSLTADAGRLEQEMVMMVQKLDIAEEIDRAMTHIKEMRRVLTQGGAVGRRLDFLLQELNREANTLGSKSPDTTLSHAAVDIKVLIEQIREQVQNLE